MEHLRVGKWKLGNGAMPRLKDCSSTIVIG